MESTVVDISMTPPSFKPVSLFLSRSPLSKTPKQVFFNPTKYILNTFTHSITVFLIYFFRLTAIQRLRKESQLNMELESTATLKAIEAIKMKHVEELERNSKQYQIEFKKLENKITNEVREQVTKEVTKKVTQEVTTDVTTELTSELTQKLTKQLTKKHKSLLENELNVKDARMNSEIEKIKYQHQTGKFFELLLHGCSTWVFFAIFIFFV